MMSTECVNEWCGECTIGERGCGCDCHLTSRQRQVLDAIVNLTAEKGYAPTVREIAKTVGLSSPCAVAYHVERLANVGRLRHVPNRPRTLTVVPLERIPA